VIRPRRFDALLFGMVIGHEMDLYAFWHSSQRNDPGLNIAQYADIEADSILEKIRIEQDPVKREELYQAFANLVQEKNASIFLYAPDFVYVINDSVHNVAIHPIAETSERFDTIYSWNIETDKVWPFLSEWF
jgi:ABC-type transport system substrate-binding protein